MRRLALAAALMVAVSPAWGDTQRIAVNGEVHRVDALPYPAAGAAATALRDTVQNAKGLSVTAWVPGTDDAAIDRDPAIELDPATGYPVLVWSRNESGGFDLFFSRAGAGGWGQPRLLVHGSGDVLEPEIHFGTGVMHVGWKQADPSGRLSLWRVSVNAATLALIYGPEQVSLDDASPVNPIGGPAPSSSAPTRGAIYFHGTIPGVSGNPGRTYVWGVRDEPVPISFRQSFILPCDGSAVSLQGASFLGGRFTYWFVDGSSGKLFYTVWNGAAWSDMRVVLLSGTTTASDARIMLAERNRFAP
jgi:hypothetical protein